MPDLLDLPDFPMSDLAPSTTQYDLGSLESLESLPIGGLAPSVTQHDSNPLDALQSLESLPIGGLAPSVTCATSDSFPSLPGFDCLAPSVTALPECIEEEECDPFTFLKGLFFNKSDEVVMVTAPMTPELLLLVRAAKLNKALIIMGANQYNTKVTALDPHFYKRVKNIIHAKTAASPASALLMQEFAKKAGLPCLQKSNMNFAWLMGQCKKYPDIKSLLPDHLRETVAANLIAGLFDIIRKTFAQFPKHSQPGPEFDVGGPDEFAAVHSFQQALVQELLAKLNLPPLSFDQILEMLDFGSDLLSELFKDEEGQPSKELKEKATSSWLRAGCRALIAPFPMYPLTTDLLEMIPSLALSWLFNAGHISPEFFDLMLALHIGKEGLSSANLKLILAAFPQGAAPQFFADVAAKVAHMFVDDEADDVLLQQAMHLGAPKDKPIPVTHVAAPGVIYGNPKDFDVEHGDPNDAGFLDIRGLWCNMFPEFEHDVFYHRHSISNSDKVVSVVAANQDNLREESNKRKPLIDLAKLRAKRARDCHDVCFKPFNEAEDPNFDAPLDAPLDEKPGKLRKSTKMFEAALALTWEMFLNPNVRG